MKNNNDIHQTGTHTILLEGQPRYIVSHRFTNGIAALMVIGTLGILFLAYSYYQLSGKMQVQEKESAILKQRREATSEVILHRQQILEFTYKWACREAKTNMLGCPQPDWWADPAKYPELAKQPDTQGIFAPKGGEDVQP